MNCRELVDFLMDYVDDDLPEHVKACFDMHLQMCPPCVEYMKSYKQTVSLAKYCFAEEPSVQCEKMPEELVAIILRMRKTQPT